MREPEGTTPGQAGDVPQFWSRSVDDAGRTVLTYAVRGGRAGVALGTLGAACLFGGAWGAWWMLAGGDATVAGLVFTIAVPGGLIAFGLHCLDTALWARREYAMNSLGLVARRQSLRGSGTVAEIPRAAVTEVAQRYSPPGPSSPSASPGTWTTFLAWKGKDGRAQELALDGMHSPDEARWLGPLLAKWSGAPLKRSHGAEFEEADPDELPGLDG
jgi:hypothetical protein